MRINARLDEERARKLRYLERATGESVTGVVRSAIDAYYREVEDRQTGSVARFEEVGFIGCAEGDPDLSGRHDKILAEDLEAKHGDR
jgi:hypothetical protein